MEISSLFTISGLVIDIIGGILLFFFGFPIKVDLGGLDQSKEPSLVQVSLVAKVGLGLLVAGFTFQLLGTFCKS